MTAYYESVLSMWIKWGYGRGTEADRQRGLEEARWMVRVLCDANAERIHGGDGLTNQPETPTPLDGASC
jgi:hypothetical protein